MKSMPLFAVPSGSHIIEINGIHISYLKQDGYSKEAMSLTSADQL